MRILLDENLPEGLVEPLRRLGHIVDSVGSLRLKGLDNGRLYREFASGVEGLADTASVSVILTVIRQQPETQFVAVFMAAFVDTDWSPMAPVREWPSQGRAGG